MKKGRDSRYLHVALEMYIKAVLDLYYLALGETMGNDYIMVNSIKELLRRVWNV